MFGHCDAEGDLPGVFALVIQYHPLRAGAGFSG